MTVAHAAIERFPSFTRTQEEHFGVIAFRGVKRRAERRVNGRGRDHKTRPLTYSTKKDMEAAGVGLDTVFKTGRFLRFRNEIKSPETRDPLKRPGEPPNRPQEFGAQTSATGVPMTCPKIRYTDSARYTAT